MIPVQIKIKEKNYLFIKWNDDTETSIKLANLRKNCTCAFCVSEKDNNGSKYIPIYSNEQLFIKDIQMIGSYAIGIVWADKHNTGIYDFNYLKKISDLSKQN
ncbi:MAG: DUF971 domain-containing protein [Bacteroidota bacterium]